jgi:hypothetical protein
MRHLNPPSAPAAVAVDALHRRLTWLIAALTTLMLAATADSQIFDTNFYTLWEATALLAGDHPYRDFFEWGVPLQAAASAVAQVVSGHRMLGEFALRWVFIAAGMAIAFRLALRLSGSARASVATMAIAVLVLASTPTYYYPKLFFYPLGIWLAWRYLDRPTPLGASAIGLATAAGFLFRHDHGVFLGVLAVLAFTAARVVAPASRTVRATAAHALAGVAAGAVIVAPWAAIVHLNEGLPTYVRHRATLFEDWSAKDSPYRALRRIDPALALAAREPRPPESATVSLIWRSDVDASRRAELERRHGLRQGKGPDADGRWEYNVTDGADPGLWDLAPHTTDVKGIDWSVVEAARQWLPARTNAQLWLFQISLLVPLLLVAAVSVTFVRRLWRREPVDDTWHILIASAFVILVEVQGLREAGYFVGVAPLTAAFAARLVAGPGGLELAAARTGLRRIWHLAARATALAVFLVTAITGIAYARHGGLNDIVRRPELLRSSYRGLLTTPPIDSTLTAEDIARYTAEGLETSDADLRFLIRYMHDCTSPGDRLLVTGSTPYHVGYFADRPIAGGHLFWHHNWRRDPESEAQSLALLQSQSVPFAISTSDPVLVDFQRYPRILEHLARHYTVIAHTDDLVLVDNRRTPTGTFGPLAWPCFR